MHYQNTGGTVVTIFISFALIMTMIEPWVHNLHTSKPAVSMGQTVGCTWYHDNIIIMHVFKIKKYVCAWCSLSL